MLTTIENILTPEEIAQVLATLKTGNFVDGRHSTGLMNDQLKANEEFDRPGGKVTDADRIIGQALNRNAQFQDFAFPAKLLPPMFNKYGVGMHYGAHIDAPILGEHTALRADLSFTIFLTSPEDYDGGELNIDTGAGETAVKLKADDAVVYSSGNLHRVSEVTRGERLCAVGWVQSRVRDEFMRQSLYELSSVSKTLYAQTSADGRNPSEAEIEAHSRLYKVYANLLRRSVEG
ncbi:MAG: Fe2+-dependent dioxygenase [Alphaproteobacteria bacterium]